MAENPAGGPPDDNDQPSWSDWDSRRTAYPLETTMNYVARVEIVETFGDIRQLVVGVSAGSNTTGRTPTRSGRPVSGCFLMYYVKSLPGTHSEISWRGV